MYTIKFGKNEAAVISSSGNYIYEFDSRSAANDAVKNADKVAIIYTTGGRSREVEITPATLQQIKIIPPTEYAIE